MGSVGGERHEVLDLRTEPGQLSFEARLGQDRRQIYFRSGDIDRIASGADAALAACLLPAMRLGGSLALPGPVSPRVLRNQREFQAIQRAWSRDWDFGDPPLEEVAVSAPAVEPEAPQRTGRVAAFFSGGVDSWATVLDAPDITDLIFVRGFDLRRDGPQHAELADEVELRLREGAEAMGLDLHVIDTNLRQLSDPLVRWEIYYACALVAVALLLAPRFERVLFAGDVDHEVQVPVAASRMVDHLWSTEQLEIVDCGGLYSRVERIGMIAEHPIVQRTLRVCWENPGGAYNCGRCRKCLMTMVTLEALGARERLETFPAELDLGAVAAARIDQPIQLVLWEDLLDAIRVAGRADLEPAVEVAVSRGKRQLGFPAGHRSRTRPGPPPLSHRGPLRRLTERIRR